MIQLVALVGKAQGAIALLAKAKSVGTIVVDAWDRVDSMLDKIKGMVAEGRTEISEEEWAQTISANDDALGRLERAVEAAEAEERGDVALDGGATGATTAADANADLGDNAGSAGGPEGGPTGGQ